MKIFYSPTRKKKKSSLRLLKDLSCTQARKSNQIKSKGKFASLIGFCLWVWIGFASESPTMAGIAIVLDLLRKNPSFYTSQSVHSCGFFSATAAAASLAAGTPFAYKALFGYSLSLSVCIYMYIYMYRYFSLYKYIRMYMLICVFVVMGGDNMD